MEIIYTGEFLFRFYTKKQLERKAIANLLEQMIIKIYSEIGSDCTEMMIEQIV